MISFIKGKSIHISPILQDLDSLIRIDSIILSCIVIFDDKLNKDVTPLKII